MKNLLLPTITALLFSQVGMAANVTGTLDGVWVNARYFSDRPDLLVSIKPTAVDTCEITPGGNHLMTINQGGNISEADLDRMHDTLLAAMTGDKEVSLEVITDGCAIESVGIKK